MTHRIAQMQHRRRLQATLLRCLRFLCAKVIYHEEAVAEHSHVSDLVLLTESLSHPELTQGPSHNLANFIASSSLEQARRHVGRQHPSQQRRDLFGSAAH